ncbi:hypothetical protein PVA45_04435 [Entomospira entomophila]|uniref:Uncharacterized protein n=1 Tax=Entomospira entomophila TaxID=2719988 RepID=A0A968KRH1_9SPIO|nr:hypothetical protein [Entomospira entomophilus]NIZ40754.1 hypothetical protein [Entomospira entomophilus]WDI34967.1 hypothetical protein PVA45_04435 [Entomospira entomophilus]
MVDRFGEEYRLFFKGNPRLSHGSEHEQALTQELGFHRLPNVNFPFELLL